MRAATRALQTFLGTSRTFTWITGASFAVLGAELLRTAWVCDDAYITFRTADNIVQGFGPVWNTAERVQGFTHPLWLAVYTAFYAITREAYYTAIAVGAALTLAGAWLLRSRIARTDWSFLAGIAALVSSKAFVDFSTAGMENALSHLLILIFLWCWWQYPHGEGRLQRLTLLASLCVLNRVDLAVLVGPAVAIEAWRTPFRTAWRAVALGIIPVVAWELFSVFYYASLVPNTAYAKLNITLDTATAVSRGLDYVMRTAIADPATLPAMALAIAVTLRSEWRRNWPLIAGLAAHLAYVVWIGGDFMMGRFLTVPLVWSAALLAHSAVTAAPGAGVTIAAVLLVTGLAAPWEPALLSGIGYAKADNWIRRRAAPGPRDEGLLITLQEITDTRRYYYEGTGLLKGRLGDRRPDNPSVDDGLALRAAGGGVVVRDSIGFVGYFAGPSVHIVDMYALTDPLLSRLPSLAGARVGHYQREIPGGYLESIRSGHNLIEDRDLADFYAALHLAVSGPLFDVRRVATAIQIAIRPPDSLRRYLARRST